jgi:plasmid stabilization system protein ParE
MARNTIHFAESALADLEEVLSWYAQQDVPSVGKRLVAEVFERVSILADQPELGRMVPEFESPSLRELIHAPFRIVYRYDSNMKRIWVVRVWRSERVLKLPD